MVEVVAQIELAEPEGDAEARGGGGEVCCSVEYDGEVGSMGGVRSMCSIAWQLFDIELTDVLPSSLRGRAPGLLLRLLQRPLRQARKGCAGVVEVLEPCRCFCFQRYVIEKLFRLSSDVHQFMDGLRGIYLELRSGDLSARSRCMKLPHPCC